jgi:replicative superfamily II helicase
MFLQVAYGSIRSIVDSTRYHLRSIAQIALLLDKGPTDETLVELLRQLEVGLPREALGLLDIQIEFQRGEYLELFHVGIKDEDTLRQAPDDVLRKVLSADRIEEVKKALKSA